MNTYKKDDICENEKEHGQTATHGGRLVFHTGSNEILETKNEKKRW